MNANTPRLHKEEEYSSSTYEEILDYPSNVCKYIN